MSPRFVMPPRLVFPPLEFCLAVRPPGAELCSVAELLEFANGGDQRRRGDWANSFQLGGTPDPLVILAVSCDALIAPFHVFVELSPMIRGALKDEVRYASDLVGGIFSDLAQPLAQHGCGLRKDHTEFAQEPADPIETGGAFLLQTLAQAMNAQHALLRDGLGRHKVHMGPGGGLADRGGVVLAVATLQAVRRDELRWNEARVQFHRK